MSVSFHPRIILGLMTYGPEACIDARVTSLSEFKEHLDLFQSCGYYEVDTARIYMDGQQERFTAEAGWQERHLHLATKSYPLTQGAHSAANLRESLDISLSELRTEKFDTFYLHAADRSVPFGETLKELDILHREGKFRQLGLSNFSAYEIAEIVMLCHTRGWIRPTIYQGVYNAISRSLETEVIPACRRYGLDVVIYNPLAGGLLTGRYPSPETESDAGRYSTKGFLGPIYRSLYFDTKNFKAIELIQSVAAHHNLSMVEVALRWCIHHSALRLQQHGGNDGVIVGASNLNQLKGNLADLQKGPLPQEVVDAIDTASATTKGSTPNPWHTPLVYDYDTQAALFGM